MKIRKILLAVLVMLLPLLVLAEQGSHDVKIGGIYYMLSGTTATVSFDYWYEDVVGSGDDVEYLYHYVSDYKGNIKIPASVNYNGKTYIVDGISDHAFYNCSGLTSVTIPHTVVSIGKEAFEGCSGLETVYISDLEKWCKIPFSDKSSNPLCYAHHLFLNGKEITELNIPQSVTSIGQYTFNYCTHITSVNIPNSVTSIGDFAFSKCSRLSSVTIPSSVTSIGTSAFYKCSGLTSVIIPNTVTSIGEDAFSGCTSLSEITIPNNIKYVGKNAFYSTKWYNNHPDGVVYVGLVVYKCKGELSTGSSITIKDGTQRILPEAFSGCIGLTSISIPNTVTSIPDKTFYRCTGLTTVIIPNSVKSIGTFAFYGCNSLTSLIIPDKVKTIGQGAFSGCSGLTSVTIPESVTSIGESAFYNCSSLTSVVIPDKMKEIAERSFQNCTGLTSVVIPDGVTSIGKYAFSDCNRLTSVNIPSSVSSVCDSVFYNCKNLSSLKICSSVTIGNSVFSGCQLKSLCIDTEVITDCFKSLYGQFGISEINIGNNSKTIEDNAFSGLANIKSIKLGNSVEQIKSRAFSGIDNLESVECKSTKVPDTHRTAFENSYVNYVSLYVPKESVEEYKSTAPWSEFKSITGISIVTYSLTYMIDGEVYKTQSYEEGDVVIPEPSPTKDGYTFSGWDNLPKLMPGEDVTVNGKFIEILPEKCSAPTIDMVKGELVFACETDGVKFHYDIKSLDDKSGEGNNIKFTNTYQISVYTSKEGYSDSDVTTKTVQMPLYDANGDGVLNAADIVAITNMIMSSK